MARRLSCKSGSRVCYGSIEYEILDGASETTVKGRNIINGEIRSLPINELKSRPDDKLPAPSSPLDCLSEEDRTIALQRFNIIKPAIVKSLTRKEIENLANQYGVHFTTIYKMIKRFRETMSPASLVPRVTVRGGKGKPRIDKAVDDLMAIHFQAIIDAKEVDLTKLPVKILQEEIRGKCKLAGLKPPAWRTVDERLTNFIHLKKLDRNRKRKGGRHKIMAGGMFPDANWPLDVVQIDHTPLDLIIVDEQLREPIGKPMLSIAMDVNSRVIVGFSLSLDSPSIFSVGRLIAHCILPKESFLEQVGVNGEWKISGMMGTILLDNAGEFRAEDFIPFQEEYLVDFRWRPVATPEYGGHIERLAKTLNDMVHAEPGSTMGDIIRRAGYDSEGHACYTLDEIEKWLTILIAKIYHVRPHAALKNHHGALISPLEKYWHGILGDKETNTLGSGHPDKIEDEERLKLFLLPSFHRTVRREGIELEKIFYFHDVLRTMFGKTGADGKPEKYLIKRDPRRLSPIFIFDPQREEYFAIPYRDLTRPPMNLWELKAARKRCKEKGIDDATEDQIFEAFGEMRQIRDQSVAKTKKARREKEAEKRRKIDRPVYPQLTAQQVSESAVDTNEKEFDITSLYDDASLLDGVIVK